MKRWVAVLLVLGIFCGVALAQSSTGSITGQVVDPQKSLIPGAQITLTNTGTNEIHKAVTSAGGVYIFPSLTPGTYNVSATAKGFEKDVVNSVEVSTGVAVTVNFMLLIGAESTTVEVKASGEMLNQDSATMNAVVDKDTVVQLPYPERSALEVATLSPGVNGDPQYSGGVQSENPGITTQPNTPGASIAIAGGRPGSASQLVDGFDVTLSGYPRAGITFSKDIIHDVTVQEGFLPAQYGRNGGGIINQSTASGASKYHGRLAYRHYDPMLEARTQGITSPPGAHQNMYTAMLSGPLPIPSRRHSKVFFLAGFEPTRVSNQTLARRRIASPNELAGYFHDSPDDAGAGIYNQFTATNAQGFPAGTQQSSSSKYVRFKNLNYDRNVCNQSLAGANCGLDDISNLVSANPVAQFLNALQPTPATLSPYVQYLYPTGYTTDDIGNTYQNAGNLYDTAGNNVQSLRGVRNADNRYSIRLDGEIDPQDSAFARYTTVPVNGTRYDYLGPNSIADQIPTDTITSRNIGIGETHIFGGAKVNELRVTYLRSSRYRGPASQSLKQDFGALMGLTPAVSGKGFPTFSFGNNLSSIGSGGAETDGGRSLDINFGVGDDFSLLVGRHTLKFGVDYRALQLNRMDDSDSHGGNYGFNQSNTANGSGGSTLATFDLGIIGTYINRGIHPFYYRWKYGAFYAQDDWRIFPKLTLNLGVRYNVETPRMEKNGMQGSFVPSVQGSVNGSAVQGVFAFSGHNGLRNTLWPTNYKGVEPRVGFAYAPTSRISLRSSYSLMHTPLTGVSNSVFPDLPIPPPFATSVGTTQGGLDKTQWVNYITNPVAVSAPPVLATPSMGPLSQYASSAGSAGTGASTAGAMPYVSQSYAVPYVQIWTLSAQLQLAMNTMVEVSYVGEYGVHLYGPPVDKNVPPLTGPNSLVSNLQAHANFNSTASPNPYGLGNSKGLETLLVSLRPYQQFYNNTIWDVFDRDTMSHYNAFYVRFLHRHSRSLTFMGAFSWSKSMDTASSGSVDGTVTDSYGFAYPQLPYSLAGEYSLSIFDQPLTFKTAYVYSLPFGQGRAIGTNKHWLNGIIGNWTTTGIFHANSGVPMHVQLGTAGYFVSTDPGSALGNEGTAIQNANIRPNRVPGQPLIRPNWKSDPFGYNGGGYLNPLAFSVPGSQDNPQLGSLPRTLGDARNPRNISIAMSIRKVIPMGSSTRHLELQADAINAVNHANYFLNTSLKGANLFTAIAPQPPNPVYGTPNTSFGKMGGASAGRIVALGATYTF